MILNYDEHSSQFLDQPASYNSKLLKHYNHDVYDKKTICIDLTSEFIDTDYQLCNSNYKTSKNGKLDNMSITLHKSYSSKKPYNNHEENTLNGMQDKDKHLIAKKLSIYNTTNACNCDYAARKSHDDLMTNVARAQHTHLNHNQMSSSPLSFQNVLAKQMTFNTVDNDSVESKFVPFKKRPFQSSNNLNETGKSTGDYLPSDNSFNFNNRKILSQSTTSLNRQFKPAHCLYDNNLNFKKYPATTTTNSFSTGLTLPITIISSNMKPIEIKTTTNKSILPIDSTTNSLIARKDWPSSFVPFKKRNFSSFLDESECSISSQSSTSTHKSSDNSVSIAVLRPEMAVKPFIKKSKEHLLDPNRQKKIKRCPHVWQFCADLLDDETYNPAIIKWLNKDRGIFKIVKPDKVADLWGAQKNRRSDKKMNYEKMARGMRYSRREGFFKKLDKEKNKPNEYGKQLVFQFSDKVVKNFDWKWSFSK